MGSVTEMNNEGIKYHGSGGEKKERQVVMGTPNIEKCIGHALLKNHMTIIFKAWDELAVLKSRIADLEAREVKWREVVKDMDRALKEDLDVTQFDFGNWHDKAHALLSTEAGEPGKVETPTERTG